MRRSRTLTFELYTGVNGGRVIAMDKVKARLRRVFGRFKKDELPKVLLQLGLEGGERTANKREFVSFLVDKCVVSNVSPREILQVELQLWGLEDQFGKQVDVVILPFCKWSEIQNSSNVTSWYSAAIISNPTLLIWKAYRLEYSGDISSTAVDPLTFCKRLHLYLGDVCNYELVDAVRCSGHWLCLHIAEEGLAPYSCFILHNPPTPFLLVASARKKHLLYILEALSLALECSGWTEVGLTGRHVDSLLDLMINRYSQGPHSTYRLNQKDPNPLLAVVRKRIYHQQVSSEHEGDTCKAKRKQAAEDCFGTNPLPRLEKFTFKLEAPLANTRDPFNCQIRFTGSNVLEGVKQCILDDLVTLPVPESLQQIPSCSSSCVMLHSNDTQDIEHSENG